jgi:NADH-quinone oxidoreductase subunit D
MLEWTCGARMLYNYIWIGGLFYDLPLGFEEKCIEFVQYVKPKLIELQQLVIENKIFIERTANIGVLPLDLAINYGVTGPILRASGLRFDLRKVDAYSVYPELDFEIPIGEGKVGKVGDCWDRTYIRVQECWESLKLVEQCAKKLIAEHKRTREFDPQALVPKKYRPESMDFYVRAENPKGELGFFFRTTKNNEVPFRVKARGPSFVNLAMLADISRGYLLADLIAIVGSIDFVMGEVDR